MSVSTARTVCISIPSSPQISSRLMRSYEADFSGRRAIKHQCLTYTCVCAHGAHVWPEIRHILSNSQHNSWWKTINKHAYLACMHVLMKVWFWKIHLYQILQSKNDLKGESLEISSLMSEWSYNVMLKVCHGHSRSCQVKSLCFSLDVIFVRTQLIAGKNLEQINLETRCWV